MHSVSAKNGPCSEMFWVRWDESDFAGIWCQRQNLADRVRAQNFFKCNGRKPILQATVLKFSEQRIVSIVST